VATSLQAQCHVYAFGGSSSQAQWIEGGSTQGDCFTSACTEVKEPFGGVRIRSVFYDTLSVRNRDALMRTMCIKSGGAVGTYPYATTSWEPFGSWSWDLSSLGLRPNSSNWSC